MAQEMTVGRGWSGVPFYTRTAIVGLLVYAAILLFFGGLATARGGELDDIVFVVIFAVPAVVVAGLAFRFGKCLALVAGVWALLNLLLNGPFILPSLAHVNSFFDFGLGVPIVVALVVATVAGGVAFVQHRRDSARSYGTPRERATLWTIVGIVVGLMALSGIMHLAGMSEVSASDRAQAIAVGMKNTEFDPTEIRLTAGAPASFAVRNSDFLVHTFTLEQADIDVSIIGGSEKLISLPALDVGTYQFFCTVPGHEDMKGTIVVN